MRIGLEIEVEPVHRVRDADGAICLGCSAVFNLGSSPYWPWRQSQILHERGTGHKTQMYKFKDGLRGAD